MCIHSVQDFFLEISLWTIGLRTHISYILSIYCLSINWIFKILCLYTKVCSKVIFIWICLFWWKMFNRGLKFKSNKDERSGFFALTFKYSSKQSLYKRVFYWQQLSFIKAFILSFYLCSSSECRSEVKSLKENIRDSDDRYESLQTVSTLWLTNSASEVYTSIHKMSTLLKFIVFLYQRNPCKLIFNKLYWIHYSKLYWIHYSEFPSWWI